LLTLTSFHIFDIKIMAETAYEECER